MDLQWISPSPIVSSPSHRLAEKKHRPRTTHLRQTTPTASIPSPVTVDGKPASQGYKELEMSGVKEAPKKARTPQIVKLDKALKLAEAWVDNMSKADDDEGTDADMEGRPARLGLGAKVSRQSKVGPSDDPVDRKLYSKLEAEKRKTAKSAAEASTITRDVLDNNEDDEDLESRTSAFTKRKAALPLTSSVMGNKKQKG